MLCDDLEGWDGDSERGLLPREGVYAYIQLIYIVVRPKRTQHCQSVMLPLKDKPRSVATYSEGVGRAVGGGFRRGGRKYACGGFMVMYGRGHHNSVK